jgi:hypothetical protein
MPTNVRVCMCVCVYANSWSLRRTPPPTTQCLQGYHTKNNDSVFFVVLHTDCVDYRLNENPRENRENWTLPPPRHRGRPPTQQNTR